MALDPTSNIGIVRLRIADYSDLPYLNDVVIQSVLDSNSDDIPKSAKTCALYILGMLSHKTHRRMSPALEVWGKEAFDSYKEFLLLTVSNPNFMSVAPVPYSTTAEYSPIIEFQNNWNANYYNITEAQQLARHADISPNYNSRTGWGSNT